MSAIAVAVALALFAAGGCARDAAAPVDRLSLFEIAAAEAERRSGEGVRRAGRERQLAPLSHRRGPDGEEIVELPAGRDLAMLASWVPGSTLEARLEVELAGALPRPVAVRLERTTEDGSTSTLVERSFARPGSARLAIGLDAWEGIAGLRFRAVGDGGGLVRWIDAALRAPGSDAEGGDAAVPPPDGLAGRDLVVVLLDAARADALGCYGGEAATPALDALAAAGTRFVRALTPAPWTLPAVAALLTGLDADTLAVEGWAAALPASVPTLAERLAAAGYDTVVWSQHPLYLNHRSLGRGFARRAVTPRDEPFTLPSATELFAAPRPTFAWIHLLPPHAPYEPPPPFRGSRSGSYPRDLDVSPGFLQRSRARRGRAALEPEAVRYAKDRYLESVAWADAMVGELVATLAAAGRFEEAILVVLADHGEAFFEHGAFLHTTDLYDEFVRVPWIVRWPRGVAGFAPEVRGTVGTVALAPTLLAALAEDTAGHPAAERSLLPTVFAGRAPARPVYMTTRGVNRAEANERRRLALELDGWKAIYDPRGDRVEMYRPATDPGEQHDLAGERPLLAAWLRQELLLRFTAHRAAARALGAGASTGTLDAEARERLRALGYL